jgi:SAM-dependent methyltransferase
MPSSPQLGRAYDGSIGSYKALSSWGWGELLNMGYYRAWELPLLVAMSLNPYQRRLVKQSVALLEPQRGETVLDIGCGRGWSSTWIARSGARVRGVDFVEEHVEAARLRYGHTEGLTYEQGDATRLVSSGQVEEASIDRIHCLECAFHFGADGRAAFLSEAYRALKPGGRLVLVDFTWKTDHPEEIEQLDPQRYVRDTWLYQEFEPLERYRSNAKSLGFRELKVLDWSRLTTARFQYICNFLVFIAKPKWVRPLYGWLRPVLRTMTEEDWLSLSRATAAHDDVRRSTCYAALVWEKPAHG